MTAPIRERLRAAQAEIGDHLENGIMRFWLEHGIDHVHGGYLTGFDEGGAPSENTDKYVVTQTRMIWGFSRLSRALPANARLREAAKQGVDFFLKSFWDAANGGVRWSVARDGSVIDAAKLVYGQSFAVYALSEYALATGDPRGLQFAEAVFDLLQKYSADTYNGGYFENLESDWRIAEGGAAAGDRKSLDIHMHLMEAFTVLYQCSGKPIHARKLEEVVAIILDRMISKQSGCGLNQFDVRFNPRPAINIKRTWNAERKTGEVVAAPTDTTSYGHNIELLWLLNRAGEALGKPVDCYDVVGRRLAEHTLRYGLDKEYGGVYRDGPHDGPALVQDKEWWQNCESMVGFLDAFEHFEDDRYAEAFLGVWSFAKAKFINPQVGEWRQLLDRQGAVISGDIGNPWKAIYHTGRAMLECTQRLRRLCGDPG
jgi:mannobiose 2-epimerase